MENTTSPSNSDIDSNRHRNRSTKSATTTSSRTALENPKKFDTTDHNDDQSIRTPGSLLIDLTRKSPYKRHSPYRCVLSNSIDQFICHTIFIISGSKYFEACFEQSDDRIIVNDSNGSKQIYPR